MLVEIKEETDIDQDWQNIKQGILDAATEFQIARGIKKPNHWWDDECKKAIQEENEARTCLIRKTRANLDNFRQKRTKANRTCKRKKKEWLKRKIKETSESNRKKGYKEIFTKISKTYLTHTLQRHWYVRIRMVKHYQMKDKYWKDGNNILKTY
jgi:t-SNARE complex subunit (syntaxin)